MDDKKMSEWAEMLQEQIQAGASKSDIIELLKEYEKQALRTPDAEGQSEQLVCHYEQKRLHVNDGKCAKCNNYEHNHNAN